MGTRWGTRPWGTSRRRRRDAGRAPRRPRVRTKTAGAPPPFHTATPDRQLGKPPSRATRARGPRAPAPRSRTLTRSPRRLLAAPMGRRDQWTRSSTRSRDRGRPAPPPRPWRPGGTQPRVSPTGAPRATRRRRLPPGVWLAGDGSCRRTRARIQARTQARRAWWRSCSLRPGERGTRPPSSRRTGAVGRTRMRRKRPRRRRARLLRPPGGRRRGKRRRGDGWPRLCCVVSERASSLRDTALLSVLAYREYPISLSIVLILMLPSGPPPACVRGLCI